MITIFKKYGKISEITTYEKEPSKVRVFTPRKKNSVYRARRLDNIRRTRKTCLRRVSSALEELGSPLLVTLTFNGDASDASFANDSLRFFQVRLRAKFPKAHSIFIPELSPRGRIHFHGLVFNVPLHLGDTREGRRTISNGTERKTRVLAKLWGQGFVDATKTDGSTKLAFYISKYITKGAGQVMFNAMRILRMSRGFPKEIVIRGKLAEEIARRYAVKKPYRDWKFKSQFLGEMTLKTYIKDL